MPKESRKNVPIGTKIREMSLIVNLSSFILIHKNPVSNLVINLDKVYTNNTNAYHKCNWKFI